MNEYIKKLIEQQETVIREMGKDLTKHIESCDRDRKDQWTAISALSEEVKKLSVIIKSCKACNK